MPGFIPVGKTIHDFQKLLKPYALSGTIDITPSEIIEQIRKEPVYDTDYVMREVTNALVASNEKTNCLVGNATEHVIVTREKLEQVLSIIRDGGMKKDGNDREDE